MVAEVIEVTEYYAPSDAQLRGNPLATVHPPLSPELLGTLISSSVAFSDDELLHPPHVRMHYTLRLMEYFYPQPHQCEFAWALWILLLNGYKHRNPLKKDTTTKFRSMCESILAGTPQVDDQASFSSEAWCATLVGTPGTGKSATARGVLRRLFPDLIHHSKYGPLFQLGHIVVQVPKNCTGKTLAQAVYYQLLAAARQTGHPIPFLQSRPTTEPEYVHAVSLIAGRLNVGVMMFEEAQNLFSGTGRMDAQAMKFLTGIINTLGIPALFVGVWPCLALLERELVIGRRLTSFAHGRFRRMQEGSADWVEFMDGLETVQFLTNRRRFDEACRARFYFHTQGIHDACVKLDVIAQIRAIQSGKERLSAELIDEVAPEHMSLIAPECERLRQGVPEESVGLFDGARVDFQKYALQLMAKPTLPTNKRATDRSSEDAPSTRPTPGGESKVKPLISPKSAKRRAAVEPAFLALDSSDLRRIAFEASRDKVPHERALRVEGYVCNLADELVA